MNLKSYKERSKLIKTVILWIVILLGIMAVLFLQTQTAENPSSPHRSSLFPKVYANDPATEGGGAETTNTTSGRPIDLCNDIAGVGCLTGTTNVGTGSDGVIYVVMQIVFLLVFIASGIAILFIVFGAYRMITSNGEEANFKLGLDTLKYATFGLALAILSMSIIYIVSNFVLNIDIFA